MASVSPLRAAAIALDCAVRDFDSAREFGSPRAAALRWRAVLRARAALDSALAAAADSRVLASGRPVAWNSAGRPVRVSVPPRE